MYHTRHHQNPTFSTSLSSLPSSLNNTLALKRWSKRTTPTTHLAASLKSLKMLGYSLPCKRARNQCSSHLLSLKAERCQASPMLPSSRQDERHVFSLDFGISSFTSSILPSFDPPWLQGRLSPPPALLLQQQQHPH